MGQDYEESLGEAVAGGTRAKRARGVAEANAEALPREAGAGPQESGGAGKREAQGTRLVGKLPCVLILSSDSQKLIRELCKSCQRCSAQKKSNQVGTW